MFITTCIKLIWVMIFYKKNDNQFFILTKHETRNTDF
jgi:hypothetical protein